MFEKTYRKVADKAIYIFHLKVENRNIQKDEKPSWRDVSKT